MERTNARNGDFAKMSYAELTKMQADIERLKMEKQNSERSEVRQKLIEMATQAGFDIHELSAGAAKGREPLR